jgi:hypothetical protein
MEQTPRHILRSNERLGWLTGRTADGEHVLCGRHGAKSFLLHFSKEGELKEQRGLDGEPGEALTIEKPVRVFEFEVPELDVGLYQLPKEFREFLDNTWDYDDSERGKIAVQINDWRESGHYVFHWDGEEYHCDEEGKVLQHKADGEWSI